MSIINDISSAQINKNRSDTFATRISIFLAVILLGTIVFIIGSIKKDEYNAIINTIGDYQVSISELNENMLNKLYRDTNIKDLSFDRIIPTNLNAVIIEKGKYYKNLKAFNIIAGRNLKNTSEIIVPEKFISDKYKIGSNVEVNNNSYKIVGIYKNYSNSFEEAKLIGILENENKEEMLKNPKSLEVYIWYKNPRDTYSLTKDLCKEFNINYTKALDTGRLFFNKNILEYKMIYPLGIIPPKYVINESINSYGISLILVFLFSIMIYGAFNVWNNRDIKELAILKSIGMTEKQIRKLIRMKVIKISYFPIFLGIIFSYLIANLLLYLMYLNNYISHKNISNILNYSFTEDKFNLISISPTSIIIILICSLLTIYLSAIVPARKSARINIVEGISGIQKNKIKYSKSKINRKIEWSLANDYFKIYNSNYKVIILTLIISALVMTLVLVSQSYRSINKIYNIYINPYNFTAEINTKSYLNNDLIKDLEKVKGISDSHIYFSKDFKFYFSDNKDFKSKNLIESFNSENKSKEMYADIIALSNKDFDKILKDNGISKNSEYILLNRTPMNNKTPYAFRKYINITNKNNKEINIRYSIEDPKIPIYIDGYVDKFPFELEGQNANGIYIFTRIKTLENLVNKYGNKNNNFENNYSVKIKVNKNIEKVFYNCNMIISKYIPENDYYLITSTMKKAMDMEQLRNETILNMGIQITLLIIALSNAYNSFYGNLRSRKRDFQLLITAGMTEKQMKKMIYNESKILISIVLFLYLIVFALAVIIRSYRSKYSMSFIVKKLLLNINYMPIVMIFIIMIFGILFSINSAMKKILKEDLNDVIRDI